MYESIGARRHALSGGHEFYACALPKGLLPDDDTFAALWRLHPDDYHEINIHGRPVQTPRWQQAYGADYHYTGRTNHARPVPARLEPYLDWCREHIYGRLNGLLLNWYDAARKHYIGNHRDSTRKMVESAPIVTISMGEARIFRLRPWRGAGFIDVPAPHGAVFIMPYATNQAFTHEVPHLERYRGRRISVTVRAFITD